MGLSLTPRVYTEAACLALFTLGPAPAVEAARSVGEESSQ